MEISFIIPIYNTPVDKLKRCLDSIKFNNISYEILLIDDGSDEKLSNEYKIISNEYNAKYFKHKNRGVSYTRNQGIINSCGKYIMFVDSDDYLNKENISFDLLNEDYDIIIFNYEIIKKDNSKYMIHELSFEEDSRYPYDEVIKDFIKNDKCYSPVAKFIKSSFIKENNIRFKEDMINGEDAIFNLTMLDNKPLLYYCTKPIYHYDYEIENYNQRLINRFDTIMNNYIFKHKLKIEMIEKYNFNNTFYQAINNEAVDHFFRVFLINKCIKLNKSKEIKNYLKIIKINKKYLSIKNKLKFLLMKSKFNITITILSKIRNIYLKLKK